MGDAELEMPFYCRFMKKFKEKQSSNLQILNLPYLDLNTGPQRILAHLTKNGQKSAV